MRTVSTLVLVLLAGVCDNKVYLIETTNTTKDSARHGEEEAGADYNNNNGYGYDDDYNYNDYNQNEVWPPVDCLPPKPDPNLKSYPDVRLTNEYDMEKNGTIEYACCPSSKVRKLRVGKTHTYSRGLCLITAIKIDNCGTYCSTGTSYSVFQITKDENGFCIVNRIVK